MKTMIIDTKDVNLNYLKHTAINEIQNFEISKFWIIFIDAFEKMKRHELKHGREKNTTYA